MFVKFVYGQGLGGIGQDEVLVFADPRSNKGVVRVVGSEVYDDEYKQGRGKVLKGMEAERLWRLAEGWQGVSGEDRGEDFKSVRAKL